MLKCKRIRLLRLSLYVGIRMRREDFFLPGKQLFPIVIFNEMVRSKMLFSKEYRIWPYIVASLNYLARYACIMQTFFGKLFSFFL